MIKTLAHILNIMILLTMSITAEAAITCSTPISTGFSTAYASAGVVPNATQGTVSFTCTRGVASDPTLLRIKVNNGTNFCPANSDAHFGGSCITFRNYQDSSCSTHWRGNNTGSIDINLASVLTPQSFTKNFWGCITIAGQTPAAGAGVYTNTFTTRIKNNGGANRTYAVGSFPISITYPATCAITSVANVSFGTYIALRATPLIATANIVMNCTNRLPYTMALSATSGLIAGLNYTLVQSAVNSRGTGPGQTHTITGTMPAGQAGTCAIGTCFASQTRTLTITY